VIEKQKVVIDQLKNKLQVEDFEHFDTLRSVLCVDHIQLLFVWVQFSFHCEMTEL